MPWWTLNCRARALKVLVYPAIWNLAKDKTKYSHIPAAAGLPAWQLEEQHAQFCNDRLLQWWNSIKRFYLPGRIIQWPDSGDLLKFNQSTCNAMLRRMFLELMNRDVKTSEWLCCDSRWQQPTNTSFIMQQMRRFVARWIWRWYKPGHAAKSYDISSAAETKRIRQKLSQQ